ncbi:MAG: ubiquitin-specific protease otu1 [Pleopsidium flavum]|nr:MAG: ubiquitin-specific protease otu1 [Pleopsidium flavum]
MRIRVRGPAGQSVITIPESATIGELQLQISEKTSLPHFDAKYGYPPKSLMLAEHEKSMKLSELGVKLEGEQLIISRKETKTNRKDPENLVREQEPSTNEEGASQVHTSPAVAASDARDSKPSAGFSFAGVGTAPLPQKATLQQHQAPQSSAPLSVTRKQDFSIETDPPELPLPSHNGTLLLRIMPDDNSCLFRAFGSAFFGFIDSMTELRSLIAQEIQAQPDTYSQAVLDQKPDDYCRWIQTEDAWGGGIELSILSKHFDLEICSIDVQTLRVDRFNEGRPTRCILVYSGIHYDTIALSSSDSPNKRAYAPPEFDMKIFEASDHSILLKAVDLCRVLQGKHYFTDTAGFSIRCNICGGQFVGEKGATEHAQQSGHYDFGEAS